MNRVRKKRRNIEAENVNRWLVSYADYMTLLFALFVVLYAMAMVNEKPFEAITESFGGVFQTFESDFSGKGGVLLATTNKNTERLHNNDLLDVADSAELSDEKQLSKIANDRVVNNLSSLESDLRAVLYDVIELGYTKLEIDGDWLEIKLSSGLLFPSGSSSTSNSATEVLSLIYQVIKQKNNYIRIRGYTDNQAINTEIFPSNWELSVYRATAILRILEDFGIISERMAIEGYGEYYPSVSNNTPKGRDENRRVVIAISKYGIKQPSLLSGSKAFIDKEKKSKGIVKVSNNGELKTLKLNHGGIRITTRNDTLINEK